MFMADILEKIGNKKRKKNNNILTFWCMNLYTHIHINI